MTVLADFLPFMRAILHDNDTEAGLEFTDEQLKAALKAAYICGGWPEGFLLSGEAVSPEVTLQAYGIIVCESTLVMMVGAQGKYSFKTRPLSETDHGEAKRDILSFCRQRLQDLRDADAIFSTRQSLMAFLNSGGYWNTVQVANTPPRTITLALPPGELMP